MRALRVGVPLGSGETPASFASRMAAANRLSAREFCLDWGVRFQSVVDGDAQAIATIAHLGGVAADALTAHAFVRAGKWSYLHHGQRFVRDALRRSRVHVCPACLGTDVRSDPTLAPRIAVHGRSLWLVDAMKTCPEHGTALVEIANDLTPSMLHDFAHHASHAAARLEDLDAGAVRRDPSGLERYIVARLDAACAVPFLDVFPLYAAIKVCEMVGAVAVFGRTPNLKRLTDDDWWRAGAAGFEIAAGGAEAIGEFLAELQRTYPYRRSSTEGPQALFGRLYQWLAFGAQDEAYDPLRALLADYIGTHLPLGPGDVVFGRPVTVRTLHSVRTLAAETGQHPKRLRKLLRAAGVLLDDQVGLPDGNAVFPAHGAAGGLRRALKTLSLQAAGRHLNAPRVHAELLAKKGFIKPVVAGRKFSAADKYAVADLDDFLVRLFTGAVTVRKPTPTQVGIPAAAKRACCSAAEILRLILNRRLAWVGKLASECGYMAVLVDVDEVRRKTRGADPGGLTNRHVAKRLRTTDRVVVALMKAGHLRTFAARDPVNRCPQVLVSHTEMDRFCRGYVSLFMLAEERGQHFSRVLKDLDAQGIEPAFDRDKIGTRIYRRRDVEVDN